MSVIFHVLDAPAVSLEIDFDAFDLQALRRVSENDDS
jgi:hypothetical protein